MNDPADPALAAGVRTLLDRFETEPEHVLHVRDLTLALFDALADRSRLGPGHRDILAAAASLHDIGWSACGTDGKGHHKESARMIRAYEWPGVAREVVERIALVARYHRKSVPSESRHTDFGALTPAARREVRWMAGMLRVADGLDRRHVRAVEGVVVRWEGGDLEVAAVADRDVEPELTGAWRKADLLGEVIGGTVQFVRGGARVREA